MAKEGKSGKGRNGNRPRQARTGPRQARTGKSKIVNGREAMNGRTVDSQTS